MRYKMKLILTISAFTSVIVGTAIGIGMGVALLNPTTETTTPAPAPTTKVEQVTKATQEQSQSYASFLRTHQETGVYVATIEQQKMKTKETNVWCFSGNTQMFESTFTKFVNSGQFEGWSKEGELTTVTIPDPTDAGATKEYTCSLINIADPSIKTTDPDDVTIEEAEAYATFLRGTTRSATTVEQRERTILTRTWCISPAVAAFQDALKGLEASGEYEGWQNTGKVVKVLVPDTRSKTDGLIEYNCSKFTIPLKDRSIEWINTVIDSTGAQKTGLSTEEVIANNNNYQAYCGQVSSRTEPIPSTTDETSIAPARASVQASIKNSFTGTLGTEWVSLSAKTKVWLCFEYTETTA